MVAGYAVGTRNPFTGYYEIKNSDAHTWVDVWFPQVGWYEFDPTFAIPPAEEDASENVPLFKAFRFAAEKFKGLPKDLSDLLRVALFILLAAVVGMGVWLLLKKRTPKKIAPGVLRPVGGGPITHAFRRFEEALAARGSPRAPPETAAELMARAAGRAKPNAEQALRAFELERYGSGSPSRSEIEEAVAELDRLAVEAASSAPSRIAGKS
jgi:transglutaminase-like putative cysteine protease